MPCPAPYVEPSQTLRETSVESALAWLRGRTASAPARWLETSEGVENPKIPDGLTCPEISAKLTPLALEGVGAIAVHRLGKWFFSTLKSELRPVVELPDPPGAPFPSSVCSKYGGDTSTRCYRCVGKGQVLEGVALTITDLKDKTKHVNWQQIPPPDQMDENQSFLQRRRPSWIPENGPASTPRRPADRAGPTRTRATHRGSLPNRARSRPDPGKPIQPQH